MSLYALRCCLFTMSLLPECPALALVQSRTNQDSLQVLHGDPVNINFKYATLGQSNLGGQGPDSGPELLVFKNVTLYEGKSLNLEVEALNDYVANVSKNMITGAFGQINLLNGRSVDLALTFRDDETGGIVHMPTFNLSFWDLDLGKKGGVESVNVKPIVAYYTSEMAEFFVQKISESESRFTAKMSGQYGDNPEDMNSASHQQLNRAVVVSFAAGSKFYATLSLSDTDSPTIGRTFVIGGAYLSSALESHALASSPTRLMVVLQADSGKWMARCHNCQNTVNDNPDTATVHSGDPSTPWSQFTVVNMSGGKIALKSDIGKYLARCQGCIVGGANDAITIHVSDQNKPWAQFTPELQGQGKHAFKTDIGKYVTRCSECSPEALYPDTVTCEAPDSESAVAHWRVVPLTFPTGMRIALQADTGKWMARCHNCQNTVNDNPDTATVHAGASSPWAQFTVVNVGGGKIALKADIGKYLARCQGCIVGGASNAITIHVSDQNKPWAQFTPEWQANGKYLLKTDTGEYVTRCSDCSPDSIYPDTVTVQELGDPVEQEWGIVTLL